MSTRANTESSVLDGAGEQQYEYIRMSDDRWPEGVGITTSSSEPETLRFYREYAGDGSERIIASVPISALMTPENERMYWEDAGIPNPLDRIRFISVGDEIKTIQRKLNAETLVSDGWLDDVVNSLDDASSMIDFVLNVDGSKLMDVEADFLFPVPVELLGENRS